MVIHHIVIAWGESQFLTVSIHRPPTYPFACSENIIIIILYKHLQEPQNLIIIKQDIIITNPFPQPLNSTSLAHKKTIHVAPPMMPTRK